MVETADSGTFANPSTYPEGGAYGQLLWWHLFVWGTNHAGSARTSSPEWSLKKFAHRVHEDATLQTDTPEENLKNWLYGPFKPKLLERRAKIEELLFGENEELQRWKSDLRDSYKRPNEWDLESFKATVKNAKDGNAISNFSFSHHQFHKFKAEPTSLIELLRTDVRATSLVGREAELAMLGDWLAEPRSIAVKCIIGGAGAGKTRLAIEACEQAEAEGWFATFLPSRELQPPRDIQILADWMPPQPTLLVVDYAATSVSGIKSWFNALALRRDGPHQKLRILLLERHADREAGWWADLLRADSQTHASSCDVIGAEAPYALPPLDAASDRRALLSEVMAQAAPLFDPPRTPARFPDPGENPWFDQHLAKNDFDTEPLYLIMAGIHAVEWAAPAALAINKLDLAQWIAAIEGERLKKFAIARGFTDEGRLLKHIAACVTLQNGCETSQLPMIIMQERHALGMAAPFDDSWVAEILYDFLPITDKIEPVRPDLIGECFCLSIIDGGQFRSDDVQRDIILRCWRRDAGGTIDTLIRCASDLAGGKTNHVSAIFLSKIVDQENDFQEILSLNDRLSHAPPALWPISLKICDYIVKSFRFLAEKNPSIFKFDLAFSLSNLSSILLNMGSVEHALYAIEESVLIYRDLTLDYDYINFMLAGALSDYAKILQRLECREKYIEIMLESNSLYQKSDLFK